MVALNNSGAINSLAGKRSKMRAGDIFTLIIYILLIISSIFLIYQIILKIFGGSWETQDIIIALLILMLGLMFNIAIKQVRFETRFSYLANDFRNHLKKHNSIII